MDAEAFIYPKDDPEPTRVPLQIKTSEIREWLYKITKPKLQQENVVVVVVTYDMSEEDIRRKTYALLEPIHNSGVRFGWFWKALMEQHMSYYTKQKFAALSRKQRRKAENE